MTSGIDELKSWAVEIVEVGEPAVILVLNGQRVSLPPLAAELVAEALRSRCRDLARRGSGKPANQP